MWSPYIDFEKYRPDELWSFEHKYDNMRLSKKEMKRKIAKLEAKVIELRRHINKINKIQIDDVTITLQELAELVINGKDITREELKPVVKFKAKGKK